MTDNNIKDWKKVREETERLIDEQEMKEAEKDEEEGGDGGDATEVRSAAALGHPTYKALEEQLTLSEQKAFDFEEKAKRALADLENFRRRAQKDVDDAHRYGKEKLLTSLLPVLDSLEQALQLVDKESHPAMAEGLELTLQLFLDTLKKNNVEQMDPVGALFDPNEHEAMSVQVHPDAAPNTVITVFQKGYKLNGRVVRPARVIVAKN